MARRFDNLIGGEWVAGESTSPNRSPSNLDDVVGDFAQGSAEDVDRAVKAARKAFETWGVTTPRERSEALLKLADAIL